ncbi:MAG: GxxExxY protein [Vicinamibacterales bacterium]
MLLHEATTDVVIAAAIAVHKAMGPGLREYSYANALAIELHEQEVPVVREPTLQVWYKGTIVGVHRPDFIVDDRVVVEVKAVDALAPVHARQVLTYLQVSGLKVGLLVNFNVAALKHGIRRVVL